MFPSSAACIVTFFPFPALFTLVPIAQDKQESLAVDQVNHLQPDVFPQHVFFQSLSSPLAACLVSSVPTFLVHTRLFPSLAFKILTCILE